MPNRIAVAVIHGIGSQGRDPQPINHISFSRDLFVALQNTLSMEEFREIGYREIFWADLLQGRQEDYVADALTGEGRWIGVRKFVMNNLADAAAYKKIGANATYVYRAVNQRVADTIAHLEALTGGDCPLVILAHSMGAQIMSNYIWDVQSGHAVVDTPTSFQRLETLCGMMTFGCNIPVFTFDQPKAQVQAIARPGTERIPLTRQLKPWWINLNDRDDVLGMPLREAGKGYADLAARGDLSEHWINVGGLFSSWTPFSHSEYWGDRNFYEPVSRFLQQAQAIGPV